MKAKASFHKPHIEYNGWKARWECRSRDGFSGAGDTPLQAFNGWQCRRFAWGGAVAVIPAEVIEPMGANVLSGGVQ